MTSENAPAALDLAARHRARQLAYWNGLLWAIGNGLSSTTLIVYLALELRSPSIGLSVGLILAARHFFGVLRMATPVVLNRFVDRKTFCLATFALSAIALLALPFLSAPNVLPTAVASVWALVGLWCFNNLMQYLGTIAFYSWLADLVPTRIRGRFFGIRERWLVAGEAAGAVVCGVFAEVWQARHPKPIHWVGYAIPAVLGAIVMLTALVPIVKMPRISKREIKPSTSMGILKPFGNRAFLLLLLFGCWFSFSNGLTQTLQFTYPKDVLGVSLWLMLAWQTGMRLGQIGVSPYLGSAADRFGNKPMMLFCLLLTAQGPLFYYFASPASWWWIAGAWIVWIAYAGLNIGLPNLTLKIANPAEYADYLAIYYTCTGLCYGFNTLLSGWLFDHFGKAHWTWWGCEYDFSHSMFLLGWLARCVGIVFLLLIIEPRNGDSI